MFIKKELDGPLVRWISAWTPTHSVNGRITGDSSIGPAGTFLEKEHQGQLFANQVENREKMDKFTEKCIYSILRNF